MKAVLCVYRDVPVTPKIGFVVGFQGSCIALHGPLTTTSALVWTKAPGLSLKLSAKLSFGPSTDYFWSYPEDTELRVPTIQSHILPGIYRR